MLPTIEELFDLKHTHFAELFADSTHPWEVLHRIGPYADDHSTNKRTGTIIHPTAIIDDTVEIGEGTIVGAHCVILGPTIIGKHCEIRPGAFIRGNVLVGDKVIIGNSTEVKNSLLFNNVQIPHFNYIGDSVLGYRVHFGGGTVTSNQKSDRTEIIINYENQAYSTGLVKFGAIVGDEAELASHVVLNPGTIIGKNTILYPGAIVRGVIPGDSILKVRQDQEIVRRA